MRYITFYRCPACGQMITATGPVALSCCGQQLKALVPREADEAHRPRIEPVEDEYLLTFDHPMSKEHFIAFVAYATYDRVLLIRLYPEQTAEVRIPKGRGTLYACCNQHGLWMDPLTRRAVPSTHFQL